MIRAHLLSALIVLIAASAVAQNARSAVASTGLDTNPCTVASPCRSFTAAIAVTNTAGEVIALDSAGYGPFQVGFDLTVSGAPGIHAAVTAPFGVNAIGINPIGAHIVIRNLVLISAAANFGVSQTGGDVLYSNLVVRGFFAGIVVQGGNASLDHCTIVNSSETGVWANSSGSRIRVTVTDSVMQANGTGVAASGPADVAAVRCTLTGNATGASTDAAGTSIRSVVALKECAITNNGTAVTANAGLNNDVGTIYLGDNLIMYNVIVAMQLGLAEIFTFGNNIIRENTSAGNTAMGGISLN